MDIKVNQIPDSFKNMEIKQERVTDDTFKFILNSSVEDSELQAKLEGLIGEITEQGKLIGKKKYRLQNNWDLKK